MSTTFDDSNRQPIPRWLSISDAARLQLLFAESDPHSLPIARATLDDVREQWQRDESLGSALDFVMEVVTLESYGDQESLRAASFVRDRAPDHFAVARNLATHILDEGRKHSSSSGRASREPSYWRSLLTASPNDPIAWAELAFNYAMAGSRRKSLRAMITAVQLGAPNRHILRSASRCFMHLGEPDRAIHTLQHTPALKSDPWLAAAELAVTASVGAPVHDVRSTRRLLASGAHSPHAKSELASAMSTLEFKAGAGKKARRLSAQALQDPTENALAQVEWLANADARFSPRGVRAESSFEADARLARRTERWRDCVNAAQSWSQFEPLSDRPLILGSFVATVFLGDNEKAAQLIESAPSPHRRSASLLNNYAFALARTGRLEEADHSIKLARERASQQGDLMSLAATSGLLEFRRGNHDAAMRLYADAVAGFEDLGQIKNSIIARLFWADEARNQAHPSSVKLSADAQSAAQSSGFGDLSGYQNLSSQ